MILYNLLPNSIRVIIVVFCLTGINSCSPPASQLSVELRSAIMVASDSTPPVLTIADVTQFKWDKMFIFGPYTPVSEIEKALETKWPPAMESGIEAADTFCLLVFVYRDTVVDYCKFNRALGDFSSLASMNPYIPSNAIFSVHLDASGWLTVKKE